MTNEPYQKMIAIQSIQNRIYEIRGERVMLDLDLAALYEVETRILNQAVKRNSKRFPPDVSTYCRRVERHPVTDCDHIAKYNDVVTICDDIHK